MNTYVGEYCSRVKTRRLRTINSCYINRTSSNASKKNRNTIPESTTLTESRTLSAISNCQQDTSAKQDEATKLPTEPGEDRRDILLLQQRLREKTDKYRRCMGYIVL